jgi:mitosis inhibitor protein kinase SWE1
VLITFEGTLKIGDFGMSSSLPVPTGIEREGDREYIAPEVLSHQIYDTPADIFSLGMTILESAANVSLPDNGVPWQKLRSGDLSDAPKLSSGITLDEYDVGIERDRGELVTGKLDELVKWMLNPLGSGRPTARQILENEQVRWVDSRRRAGAVVFEGEYGPEETISSEEDWQMEL